MVCKSKWSASVQASQTHYCIPRNDVGPYTHVELAFPSAPEPLLLGYAEDPNNLTETVYGYVPAGLLKALIIKHGGVVDGEHPPFYMDLEQAGILAESLFKI